jgi:superfamily II DNA or RNA helicase
VTATPERADGRHALLDTLIGPTVCNISIPELSGDYLAEYDTLRINVALSPEERAEYDQERNIYLAFRRAHNINMNQSNGWNEFLKLIATRGSDGRRAFRAYLRQKELSRCIGKMDQLPAPASSPSRSFPISQ